MSRSDARCDLCSSLRTSLQKRKHTQTASFWVYAQTTQVVVSNPTLICGVVPVLCSVEVFRTLLHSRSAAYSTALAASAPAVILHYTYTSLQRLRYETDRRHFFTFQFTTTCKKAIDDVGSTCSLYVCLIHHNSILSANKLCNCCNKHLMKRKSKFTT